MILRDILALTNIILIEVIRSLVFLNDIPTDFWEPDFEETFNDWYFNYLSLYVDTQFVFFWDYIFFIADNIIIYIKLFAELATLHIKLKFVTFMQDLGDSNLIDYLLSKLIELFDELVQMYEDRDQLIHDFLIKYEKQIDFAFNFPEYCLNLWNAFIDDLCSDKIDGPIYRKVYDSWKQSFISLLEDLDEFLSGFFRENLPKHLFNQTLKFLSFFTKYLRSCGKSITDDFNRTFLKKDDEDDNDEGDDGDETGDDGEDIFA